MILNLIIVALLLAPSVTQEEEPLTWDSDLHQYVIVKATVLMPQGLQNQILKHRRETLAGCLDVLRAGYNANEAEEEIKESFNLLIKYLDSKVPFSKSCYQLGKISALINEYASPIRGTTLHQEINLFKEFVLNETKGFPLTINQQGEGFIKERDLDGYLSFQYLRNIVRREQIESELRRSSDQNGWSQQKSAIYGLAALCYNDMVVDTSRLWLMAWEKAGGSTNDAPYFDHRRRVNK